MVLVFTCADEATPDVVEKDGRSWRSEWATKFTAKMWEVFRTSLDISSEAFVLDARKSSSEAIKALRVKLHALHTKSVERAPKVPKVCDDILRELPKLREGKARSSHRSFLKAMSR